MKHLKLTVGPKGDGKIFLDGVDISDKVVGVDIQAYAGERTKVMLAVTDLKLELEIPLEEHPSYMQYGGNRTFH